MFYFFAEKDYKSEIGVEEFLKNNETLNFIFGDGMFEIASMSFTMKEFASPVVNRKGFNSFIKGKDFSAYFKGMVGVDSTDTPYDIRAIDLTYF